MAPAGNLIISGYLHKKKREGKKSLLGSWVKRYFELTDETLTYAKDEKQLRLDGGNVEVFAVHELQYVKRMQDNKLEIKFPERVLRLKGDTPDEADAWQRAIEDAHRDKLASMAAAQQQRVAQEMRKYAGGISTAFTIEASDDDEDEDAASPNAAQAKQSLRIVPPARPPTPPKPSPKGPDPYDVHSDRPPSPRSLLANPRMGNMMIISPTRAQPSDDEADGAVHEPVTTWKPESDADSPSPRGHHPHRQHVATPTQQQPRSNRPGDELLTLEVSPSPQPKQPQPRETAPVAVPLPRRIERPLFDEPAPALRGGAAMLDVAIPAVPPATGPGGIPRGPRTKTLDAEVLTLSPAPPPAPRAPSGSVSATNSRPVSGARSAVGSRPSSRQLDPAGDDRLDLGPAPGRGSNSAQAQQLLQQPGARGPVSRGNSQASLHSNQQQQLRSQPSGTLARRASMHLDGGDDNWLDDDWDSSDEEAAPARRGPRQQHAKQQQQHAASQQQPKSIADDFDDSDDDDGGHSAGRRAPAGPALGSSLPQGQLLDTFTNNGLLLGNFTNRATEGDSPGGPQLLGTSLGASGSPGGDMLAKFNMLAEANSSTASGVMAPGGFFLMQGSMQREPGGAEQSISMSMVSNANAISRTAAGMLQEQVKEDVKTVAAMRARYERELAVLEHERKALRDAAGQQQPRPALETQHEADEEDGFSIPLRKAGNGSVDQGQHAPGHKPAGPDGADENWLDENWDSDDD